VIFDKLAYVGYLSLGIYLTSLSKTQASLSTSVLQSSSTLGTGKASTFQERQEKDEDIFVKKSLLGQSGKRKRHQDIFAVQDPGDEDLADGFLPGQLEADREFQNNTNGDHSTAEVGVVEGPPSLPPKSSTQTALSVGSALQRNANGSVIAPKIRPMSKGKHVRRALVKSRFPAGLKSPCSRFNGVGVKLYHAQLLRNRIPRLIVPTLRMSEATTRWKRNWNLSSKTT
jgi:hypothetical protein